MALLLTSSFELWSWHLPILLSNVLVLALVMRAYLSSIEKAGMSSHYIGHCVDRGKNVNSGITLGLSGQMS